MYQSLHNEMLSHVHSDESEIITNINLVTERLEIPIS
jgi:hypothetical protein